MLDRGQPVPGPGGRLWLDGALFDITERRAAEEALLRARGRGGAHGRAARVARPHRRGRRRRPAQDRARPARRRAAAARRARARRPGGARAGVGEGPVAAGPFLERLGRRAPGGLGRAARAGPRHPPGRADRARAGAGDRRARRPASPVPGRGRRPARRAAPARGRGDRLLHGRRGADQRRQVRGGHARRSCASPARTATSSSRSATTASAAREPAAGSGLSGLADRVGARDGTLSVESPPGEGTLVRAVLPLNA